MARLVGLVAERAASPGGGGGPRQSTADLIPKLEALQQELSLISAHPLLALPEAADVVLQHTGADLVGIYSFADDEPDCAALLAASGPGAAVLERHAIVRGGEWSAVQLADGGQGRLSVPDAAAYEGDLPRDLQLLRDEAGTCSFLAAAIGPAACPKGVLLLGKQVARGFEHKSSSFWLSAAATGLLQHVRPAPVAQAVRVARAIHDAGDPVSAISALLQSAGRFMWRATNVSMGVRLALIEDGGQRVLVFESERATACKGDPNVSTGRSVVLPKDPTADVTVRELGLANTLLASAVAQRKARFIKDCATYMQNCASPARDVFTHASQTVSSLVVVPVVAAGTALGALYFTQEAACDFGNIQEALLGFAHCMTLPLFNKLHGAMPLLKTMVQQVERTSLDIARSSAAAAASAAGRSLAASHVSSDGDDEGAPAAPGTETSSDSHLARDAPARLSKVSSRRLCTEAMLKVLQQEIRKGRRRSSSALGVLSDLVIAEPLGHGGFGHVYHGTWHTTPAAIKVMNARSSDGEAVSDAMEMAVLSSVQHPAIVQVYACLTDMVEVDEPEALSLPGTSSGSGSGGSGGGAAPAVVRPRYRRALPGEDLGELQTKNIVVMEFADRGTLREAVAAGAFHRAMEGGAIGVDLLGVVNVLQDVAHALAYLHGMSLLHCDVKLDNVLLRSDPSRPSGFAPKLADFGLAKILRETDHAVNHSGAGTVTHLAPEMFRAGSRITAAVDVYAFGITMWEFYCSRKPYAGLSRDAIINRVLTRGMRPTFPQGPPPAFVSLATACWAADPAARPPVRDVIASLQRIAAGLAA
ncbi:MAG: kinase-like domain-containing protein [Monoraphidium minutum]|nr:MAG: kinase-like domain-containing protein [Monoraphidium minutum]